MREMADPASTLSLVLGVVLSGLFTILFLQYSSHWLIRVPNSGARLPKGSFGWPIFGETLALIQDPHGFALSHQKRYGSIFKSHLFLRKSILGTTPEFVKFVMSNPALFPVQYPPSLVISPNSIIFDDGPRHAAIKKLFLNLSLPESLQTMVQTLESIILENLALWEEKETFAASDMTERLSADTRAYIALGIKNIHGTSGGREALQNLGTIYKAFKAFPVNLPGTAYNRKLKGLLATQISLDHKGGTRYIFWQTNSQLAMAETAFRVYLKSILQKQRSEDDTKLSGMLGVLIQAAREQVEYLDDDSIIDQMLGSWLVSFKNVGTSLTYSLKYLVDYPDIFRHIEAEQQQIRREKDLSVAGSRLTLEDTRKMVYTTKFIQEVNRNLSLSNYLPRKATEDVVYDGFLIPKGWSVLAMTNFVHKFDPASHKDPTKFNPDRFDASPKPYTYLPFGAGIHRCPGEELAKLEMLIFIHHLTTKYTYESVGPDRGVERNGFPVITGGYPIKLRPMK